MKLVYISAGVVNAEEDRELPGLKKAYRQAGVSTIKKKDSMHMEGWMYPDSSLERAKV